MSNLSPASVAEVTSELDLTSSFYDLMFGHANQSDELNPVEAGIAERLEQMLSGDEKVSALIPPLSRNLTDLSQMLRNDSANFESLNTIIEKDVGMAADVVKLANSPIFRRNKDLVVGTEEAIRAIGMTHLADLVARKLLADAMKVKPIFYKMFGQQIWSHSLECAIACRIVGAEYDKAETYFLGLVHDVGKIIIFRCLIDAFAEVGGGPRPGGKLFREMMTEYSLVLSHLAAQEWGLPEEIIVALEQQQSSPESGLALVLYDANLLCEINMLVRNSIMTQQEGTQLAICMGPEKSTVDKVFNELGDLAG
jgi:HD-like signal output (HDOD) protein